MFKKISTVITLAAFIVSLLPVRPVSAQPDEKIKIAVMDLKARRGIDAMTVLSLTDLICTEILNLGGYEVIGRDDMQAMLEHISDKQILECDDTKCLAQVGGALGVEQLFSGNIGMIGATYLINLKLIDIENATVLYRLSEEYTGDEAGLIGKIRSCTRTAFAETAPAPAQPAAAAPVVPEPAAPAPVSAPKTAADTAPAKKFPWFWAGVGGLVVAGGIAAVLILLNGPETPGGDEILPDPPSWPSIN